MEKSEQYTIELQTKPLGFLVSIPEHDGNTGGHYLFRLDKAGAQALVVALLAQTKVAGELDSSLVNEIGAAVQDRIQADAKFLRDVGVCRA